MTRSEIHELTPKLQEASSTVCENKSHYDFEVTLPFNHQWNYLQHPQAQQAIAVFCKNAVTTYGNLPLDSSNKNYNRTEKNLLKWFSLHNVVHISLELNRLLYDYSLDFYWIKLPYRPFLELTCLLNYLPFSQNLFTEDSIHLWTVINKRQAHWMNSIPEWTVRPIFLSHNPFDLNPEWFDSDLKKWNTPRILSN
jgi:hypothetical protein